MRLHRHRWEQTGGARCEWLPEQTGGFSYAWVFPARCTVCGKRSERYRSTPPEWLEPDALRRVQVSPYDEVPA